MSDMGGMNELKLSGKGQGVLKLSGHGNECKPLPSPLMILLSPPTARWSLILLTPEDALM